MCTFRSRDYENLVELGAKIGVKIRERDGEGGGNKAKVRTRYIRSHMTCIASKLYDHCLVDLGIVR